MKAYKFLPLLFTFFLGGCYVMDVPEPEQPSPVVKLSLDDDPFSGKETINIDYESSATLTFDYEDISRIVAEAPLGWTAVVKMTGGSGSLKISAPKYGTDSVQDGVVNLKIYNGTGTFIEKALTVHAVEGELRFSIVGFDVTSVAEFTLGSRTTINYDCSASFKNLEYDLPAGWKHQEKARGSFVIIAPDLTVDSGDATGTVTVTPVSWSGARETALAVSFPVRVDPTKPTFQFVENEVSFNFGETKELEIAAKGLKDIVYPATPDGWTIDWSKIADGTVTVTSPAADAASFKGQETLALTATSNADNSSITSNSVVVRLFGINSTEDFMAFRSAYEGVDPDDPNTDPAIIGKWMTNDKLSLNADIAFDNSALQKSAYVVKNLRVPFTGNGHTITVGFDCNAAVAAFFQAATVEISDLKLAGSIANSYETAISYNASLVARPQNCTCVNISSSVNIHYKVGSSIFVKTDIGGIVGRPSNNYGSVLKNCEYSGTITCDSDPFSVGGIACSTDAGQPGSITTVEDCVFSGEIILNHHAYQTSVTTRVGGIMGDLARQGVITGCTSSGTITVNANGARFAGSTQFGFGGIVARTTAPANGYTMSATIKNCTFSGLIKVNNAEGGEVATCYGQIVGCIPNDNARGVTIRESCSEEGTISL